MKRIIALALSLVLLCGFALHAGETTFGLKPFPTKQTLRIGFFAGSPLSYPFYFAERAGFWKELNIDVVFETFTNGPAMMEANSNWDIAGCGEGGLLTGMVGYDVHVIGISDYEDNLALFARPGSKLALNPDDPASWKGTTWLYPIGTTAQATLVAGLEKHGLGMNDVNSINMDVASALTGFMGSQGEGLAVWNAIAFAAEDRGLVRIGDAGTLGFVAPCATLANIKALEEKKELIAYAYAVFYLTWEWCKSSPENFQNAIQWYLENCEDEGIACDLSIATRVMEWVRTPFLKESIDLFVKTSPDAQGLYTKRDILQAEKDILVGMDFFISQNKYTRADRDKILDKRMVDPVIALAVQKMIEQQGIGLKK